jgi:hypothetical protein
MEKPEGRNKTTNDLRELNEKDTSNYHGAFVRRINSSCSKSPDVAESLGTRRRKILY